MKERKTCFIITPIGAIGSDIRRHIQGINHSVIEEVLNKHCFNMKVSHESSISGSIKSEIINDIYNSDLVIANLTYQNPNVMYELAIRHCTGKPVIHITEEIEKIPFDINDHRTIKYTNDMEGVRELKVELDKMLTEIENNPEKVSNPVMNALGEIKIINIPEVQMEYKDMFQDIIKKIDAIDHNMQRKTRSFTGIKEVYLKGLHDEKILLLNQEATAKYKMLLQKMCNYIDCLDSPIRVHELAKNVDAASLDVMNALSLVGIEVQSHMSVLGVQEFEKIRDAITNR